jgi:hypothetical protein
MSVEREAAVFAMLICDVAEFLDDMVVPEGISSRFLVCRSLGNSSSTSASLGRGKWNSSDSRLDAMFDEKVAIDGE